MKYALALVALFPLVAWATDPKPPPTPAQQQAQNQSQSQTAGADASAIAAASNALSIAGDRTVTVAQGSQVLYGCGASVNGGGSNGRDAGFLGFQWVTRFCKDAQMAAFYFNMGDPQTACDILRTGGWGEKAAKRGVKLPAVCQLPPPEPKPVSDVPVNPVVVLQGDSCARYREGYSAGATKAFEECVRK